MKARILAEALDEANGQYLDNNKAPSRKAGELDNRGSHFYLALYWAQALAAQTDDPDLAATFAPLAATLAEHEDRIVEEINGVQGAPADVGGYYVPDPAMASAVMRPSPTFNTALATLGA